MVEPDDHRGNDRDGFARDEKDGTHHRLRHWARVDVSSRKREDHAVGFVTLRRVIVIPVPEVMESRNSRGCVKGKD